jgi:hypothetical protein
MWHPPGPAALYSAFVLGIAACAPAAQAVSSAAPTSTLAQRAEEATLYALPLVIMDLTREQFFASPPSPEVTPNRFLHIPILGNPSFRSVVRPNVDTLYSSAWLDLSAEPVILSVPPSNGRYFLIQCMDAWTNVFAAPGIRTLGNKAATYAITGPDWHGELPAGTELIRSPTPMVWVLGRVYVRDPADLADARVFQRQLDLRLASRVGDVAFKPAYPEPRAAGIKRRIMRDLLRELTPEAFFERFARLAAANPASPRDPKFVGDVLMPLGFGSTQPVHWPSLAEPSRRALAASLEQVLVKLEDRAQLAQQTPLTATPWTSLAANLAQGDYGTNYPARAAVAAIGLGANLRADALYMNAGVDASRQPLDGDHRYRLRFAAGQTPPVRGFWSVTLYDQHGYLVPNPADRYAVKSGDSLVREPDGALVIYLQPDDPGPEHRANWLPTVRHQRFELSLRAYWPEQAMLDGQWIPPAVTLADAP